MSKKPKNSVAKNDRELDVDRPFEPVIWKQAQRISSQYKIVIWFEDGEWYGRGLELPLTMSDGTTPDKCVANVREAMAITVATLLEDGETPPLAMIEGSRSA